MYSALILSTVFVEGCKKKIEEPATTMVAPPAAPSEPPPPPVVEMAKNFTRVYFDFDSSTLTSQSKSALDANVQIMKDNGDIKLELQGHADERGTTDYNLALGQRRANSVYQYMTAGGIPTSRLKVISYGEERPRERGASETAWAQNRRAEFVITWKGEANVSGTDQ